MLLSNMAHLISVKDPDISVVIKDVGLWSVVCLVLPVFIVLTHNSL